VDEAVADAGFPVRATYGPMKVVGRALILGHDGKAANSVINVHSYIETQAWIPIRQTRKATEIV